jgi:hypothetical protein
MEDYAWLCIYASRRDALISADPVDLGARSDLIGARQPMSIEAARSPRTSVRAQVDTRSITAELLPSHGGKALCARSA